MSSRFRSDDGISGQPDVAAETAPGAQVSNPVGAVADTTTSSRNREGRICARRCPGRGRSVCLT